MVPMLCHLNCDGQLRVKECWKFRVNLTKLYGVFVFTSEPSICNGQTYSTRTQILKTTVSSCPMSLSLNRVLLWSCTFRGVVTSYINWVRFQLPFHMATLKFSLLGFPNVLNAECLPDANDMEVDRLTVCFLVDLWADLWSGSAVLL
jgi:hypothetical protein